MRQSMQRHFLITLLFIGSFAFSAPLWSASTIYNSKELQWTLGPPELAMVANANFQARERFPPSEHRPPGPPGHRRPAPPEHRPPSPPKHPPPGPSEHRTMTPVALVPDNPPSSVHQDASTTWPWATVTACMLAAVAVVICFVYYRRLGNLKSAAAALNPHHLCVHIDDNVTITEVTEALCKMTGYSEKYLLGKPLVVLNSPLEESPKALQRLINIIQRGESWSGEVQLRKRDGTALWTDVVISPLRRKNEKAGGYTVLYQDATKRKHFETLAVRDELTGLYNRRHFNTIGPEVLVRARKAKQCSALLILDVDNFKKYNDNYGHPAGDKVLASIGATLLNIFQRNDDLVFRLGGEEFGVLVTVPDIRSGCSLAENILSSIAGLNIEHLHNPPGFITVSIGIKGVGAQETVTLETMYKQADSALYKAKESGRNRLVLWKGSESA